MHPPSIQQMPAHHAHHHHPLPIYNIDPDVGGLIPAQPPEVPRQLLPRLHSAAPHDPAPAVREPRAEPAQMAAAPAAGRPSAEQAQMAAAPVAQKPWAEPARGAVGAPRPAEARSDWVRDLSGVPDPHGGESSPLCWRFMPG